MIYRILSLTALAVLVFPAWLFCQSWEQEVSRDGNFSLLYPVEPELKINEVEDPVFGALKLHQLIAVDTSAVEGEMVYTVFYTDYPSDLVHQDSTDLLEEFFLATAESAAYSVAGNLIYSAPYHGFECPGYAFRIHYNQGDAVIRSRAFMCCSRLYILSVAGLAKGVSTENMNRYFDSFRLLTACMPR